MNPGVTFLSWLSRPSSRWIILLGIPILSFSMHYRIFSIELMGIHVWRQTQTETAIRNFAEEDMNILNPRRNSRGAEPGVFRMEFPLMQWLFAAGHKVLGNTVSVSRYLSFLIGLFSVWGMYFLVLALTGSQAKGLIAAWAFNFSPLFYYYTVNPLPDNLALCLAIYGMAFFFLYINQERVGFYILSCIFLGIAALVKLPFALFYSITLTLFFPLSFTSKKTMLKLILITTFLPAMAWYAYVIPDWKGNGIVAGVFARPIDSYEYVHIFFTNLISIVPELIVNFGALLFLFAGIFLSFQKGAVKQIRFKMLAISGIAFFSYYLYELNMIGTVHDYYLFPFLVFIFILISLGAFFLLMHRRLVFSYLSFIALIVLPFTAYLRADSRWNPEKPGFNKDLLIHKQKLSDVVPDESLVVAGNDESQHIFLYYIHKKGWCFDHDLLDKDSLDSMIEQGAGYLFCDSRKVDQHQDILKRCDSLLLEAGTIKVWKLKQTIHILE